MNSPARKRAASSTHADGDDRGGKFQQVDEEESDHGAGQAEPDPPDPLYSPFSPAHSDMDDAEANVEAVRQAEQMEVESAARSSTDVNVLEQIAGPPQDEDRVTANIEEMQKLKKKFGTLKPSTELIDQALSLTQDVSAEQLLRRPEVRGLKESKEASVSRVDRPLPADEPGRGAEYDQHRAPAVPQAKHVSEESKVDKEKQ